MPGKSPGKVKDKKQKSLSVQAERLFCEWPRQESNLNQKLRKLPYYPLYYAAGVINPKWKQK